MASTVVRPVAPAAPSGALFDFLYLVVPGVVWGASFLFIAEGLTAVGPAGEPAPRAAGAAPGAPVGTVLLAGHVDSERQGAGALFALGLAAFAAHLAWQIARIDIGDPESCLKMFRANRDAGLILFAALLLDAAARRMF